MSACVFLLVLLFQLAPGGNVWAATIEIVDNPYSFERYQSFALNYMKREGIVVEYDSSSELGLFSPFNQHLMGWPGKSRETRGCLAFENAVHLHDKIIRISDGIEVGDAVKFAAVQATWLGMQEGDLACASVVHVNSRGGKLEEALLIAKQMLNLTTYVVVEENGECLSSCVFLLFAGKLRALDGDSTLAMAFSNSTIGIHEPSIPNNSDLQSIVDAAKGDPNFLFKFFGKYGNKIAFFVLEERIDPEFLKIFLSTAGYDTGEFYLLNSPVERKAFGIETVFLPTAAPSNPLESDAEQLCHLALVDQHGSQHFQLKQYTSWYGGYLMMYHPVTQMVCFAHVEGDNVSVASFPHTEADIAFDNTPPQDKLGEIALAGISDLLKQLHPELPTLYMDYIGKKFSPNEDAVTQFGTATSLRHVFRVLHPTFSDEASGFWRGSVMFKNGISENEMASAESNSDNTQFSRMIRNLGFASERHFSNYVFAALVFKFESIEQDDKDDKVWIPVDFENQEFKIPHLRNWQGKLSRKCPSLRKGICSGWKGRNVNDKLERVPLVYPE